MAELNDVSSWSAAFTGTTPVDRDSSPQYTTPPEVNDNAAALTPSLPVAATATTADSQSHVHHPATGQTTETAPASRESADDDDVDIHLHPWTTAARHDFHTRFSFSNPTYKNKLRLTPQAESRVRHYVLNPNLQASTLTPHSSLPDHTEARFKARSKHWTLRPYTPGGTLYRSDGQTLRRHISSDEVWALLTSEHVRLGHRGRDRMLNHLKERYIGYTLDELMFVLQHCRVCSAIKALGDASAWKRASVGGAEGGGQVLGVQRLPSPGFAGMPTQDAVEAAAATVSLAPPIHPQYVPVMPAYAQQTALGGYAGVQLPPRRNMYAPVENGLVRYDVPDWYCNGFP